MREIKFRAWNSRENRWATTEEFLDLFFNATLDKFGGGREGAPIQSNMAREAGTGDLELMQFTGLRDKNGKEIYEGDVVRHRDDMTALVVWVDCTARFAVEAVDTEKYGAIQWTIDVTVLEVIGNIHENPELLGRDT